jgi:hypothetical protein
MTIKEIHMLDRAATFVTRRHRQVVRITLSVGAVCLLMAAALSAVATQARADFGFEPGLAGFDGAVTNQDGSTDTQAGSHPFAATTSFSLNRAFSPSGQAGPAGNIKDLQVDIPPGLVGNPTAVSTCTPSQLSHSGVGLETPNPEESCPATSQVGVTAAALTVVTGVIEVPAAVYNMAVPAGSPALFGFDVQGVNVYIGAKLRTGGDYGLSTPLHQVSAALPLTGTKLTLWGVPGDPAHDIQRCPGLDLDSASPGFLTCDGYLGDDSSNPHSFDLPVRPFLTLPTSCAGPQTTTITVNSWQNPGVFVSSAFVSHDLAGHPVGGDGCNRLDFSPTITSHIDTTVADSPTGLHVDLHVPQNDNPDALAEANLKTAVVTLPAGVSVNPAAAEGLEGCSAAQIDIHGPNAASCPDGSKVGTVEVDTPLLDHPIKGAVYLAAQNDNPTNSVLGVYITVDDPQTGIVVKLAGKVHADPATGQLSTTFEDNPQLPFSDFKLDFFGGPHAALATPDACGNYATATKLTPWSGTPDASPSDTFAISSGCSGGFVPSFAAGVTNPSAARSSDFTLQIDRADGQQHIKSVTTTLPAGLLADVGSVPLCSDGDAAAGTCPASSQVGSTDTSAGPGSDPFHIAGKVFLTGPYKGGPYGLSIVVPAKAGPFDLGTVVVRAAIAVDPIDAHVTVTSDDVPSILDVKGNDGDTDGFPLRIRSIDVDVNRPGFIRNPTSCEPMSVIGALGSWEGTSAPVSSRFQIGDCQALALSPKLAISLTGKGQTTDDKHPGVHAVVSQTAGQSNLKKVTVSLPLSLALDPDNAQALCEFADGSKVDPTCPKGSIVGHAVAKTPILDQPLSGPVYFVKNIRKDPKSGREIRTLPKLVIPLTGENGIRLNLVGTSNVVDNRLVNTFDNIPDAPVSDFTLDIDGGKSGILVVSGADICKSTQVADQQIDGQNGKTADGDVYLQTAACPLKVLSKTVGKTSVAVKVGGLSAGKVTVTGKGIKKTTKTITKSTVATITAKRTKGKPGKVTVSFDPAGPAKARKTSK